MRKADKRLLKKIIYVVTFSSIVFGLIQLFGGDDGKLENKDNPAPSQPPTIEEKPDHTENSDPESIVRDILSLSKKGKVLHAPFMAGSTEIQAVQDKWGEPDRTDEFPNGFYVNYPDHHVTLGYKDDLIFDIRSFHSELQTIQLNEIKEVSGEPDEVRYYKDETHDQIILVYQVNSMYQLKWVLPKPTDSEPDPNVHHVSVYTPYKNDDDEQKAISEVISNMSLNEKIGQMIFAGITGPTLNANTRSLINNDKVGGIIFYPENLQTPQQTVQLLNQIKSENAHNRLPLLLGVDQEGGRISRLPGDIIKLPTNKQIGTINNPKLSYEIGALLGMELKAFGFNLDFAPVLDVNSNPNNPVIGDRSFGNNPEIVSSLGIETMKGIQSQKIISVIKHFPGHGDTSVDSHLELPEVDKNLEELKELELIPFKRAIGEGADVVMAAHILLPKLDAELPSSISKRIITDILRKRLNFNGVIITDDMTMEAITDNYEIGRAAVESVKAGSDIVLVAHDYENVVAAVDSLNGAVQNGEISIERINASVTRIIQLKRKYDVDDEQVDAVNVSKLNQSIRNVLNTYID
ncbi:beta-N-acetylhexosaminidase [Alkalihalobacillus sp. AL-G]|uniref:beta-N-acetylhexosaminidase n=1 Tax=Alkalihalobacillus sp. AL-G TaxID=2926399 RepID=UPI00272B08FB|nr:beta-N-acetylhexosaminidase [Alkalihalobacillus sp. AL-G]WLD93602.1 beta-N-acetylhexosaminidase [Alkalihalobacillus sp. AL-G]